MAKILVIDDHLSVREGTKTILESEEKFEAKFLIPPYTNERIDAFDFSEFDVILMDLNLGVEDINGIELSKMILKKNKDAKIIMHSGYNVDDYWNEAIRVGIYGVINKSDSKERIIDYIRHVLNGEIVISFKHFQKIKIESEEALSEKEINRKENLITEREKAILIEVEKGLTNQEIADKLHLSKRSIEYSLSNIYTKLKIGTRTEAVLIAKSENIID